MVPPNTVLAAGARALEELDPVQLRVMLGNDVWQQMNWPPRVAAKQLQKLYEYSLHFKPVSSFVTMMETSWWQGAGWFVAITRRLGS